MTKQNPGYSVDELRQILSDLIAARHIDLDQAEERLRQRAQEYEKEINEGLLPVQKLRERDRDLVQTIIDILPDLLIQNNKKLIEDIKATFDGE